MFRSLFTLALSLFLVAEASAQTASTTKAKSAKATARTQARVAKKERKVTLKTLPAAPVVNDGWPPLDDTQTAVATTSATNDGWGYENTAATTSRGELDNANVYAAPGMPIHIRTSKVPVPYSVRPPRKAAAVQTTLGN
ncbi:hypothetical protein I2I05_13460 [Hymenobacter sp. BT683]|uniref:Uncharacterized protein n=1 Tax=Hymenobacter jeongseonensis TaxID=2791027 RepID=A0ABS0IJS2_9BACT|nr:hypothetical protein [Hymenobacter jeongseonensis]MBF9238407.1 hypothetical protein [Hymenobacter jeongseonensis]